MTNQEKETLKAEIISEIEQKLKGTAIREDTQSVLSEVRNKWFRDDENGKKSYNGCLMYNVFGSVVYWTVWELIRKLTCLICGVGYVRNLQHKKEANFVAERICQLVYDLRIEMMNPKEKLNGQ